MPRRPAPFRSRRSGLLALCALLLLLAPAARAQPEQEGQWTPLQSWPDTGTHLILMPDGKVVSWAEYNPFPVYLWDPAKGVAAGIADPGFNVFCAGHTLLADGRLFVAGGHFDSNIGLPDAAIYDPATDTWTRLPDMNAGRWYPTTTLLPNGDVLVIAGTDTARLVGENRLPQVWETANNRWRDLTGAQATLRTYPWMFVAPNGKLFMAGPDPVARYLDTTGTGAWTDVAPSLFGDRFAGSAVMYEDGKVLVTGGGEAAPTETAEVIDLNAPAPAWRRIQSMAYKRKQHNMTLLPDGTVLVTGGSSGPGKSDPEEPALAAELWDPVTETFTELASEQAFRGYHSTALLLPDGRVLSTGGERVENMQLFSPPYLFKGPRPTVTSGPRAIGFGQPFRIQTPDAASIRKVTLLRTGAVTHAFNQSQRIHVLDFTPDAGGLTITPPADSVAAQPGHFMLFLVNEQGVPSLAHFVKLGAEGELLEQQPTAYGSSWKYDVRGVDPGEGWRDVSFDDSSWKVGQGRFGTSGQGDVKTQLTPGEAQASVYFRKAFQLRGSAKTAQLEVQHRGGVAVWLNGTLVASRDVDAGTQHDAFANPGAVVDRTTRVEVPVALLVEGDNQLAVVLKRPPPSVGTGALRFDLALNLTTNGQVQPVPFLTLKAPNGGEALQAGTDFQVEWSTDGTLAEVKLEYSTDGGAGWQPLAGPLPNTGSYAWRVPGLASQQVLVRVSGASGSASADVSDAPFSVSAPEACPVGSTDCGEPGEVEPPPTEPSLPGSRAAGCQASPAASSALALLLALRWVLRGHRRGERVRRSRGRRPARRRRGASPW